MHDILMITYKRAKFTRMSLERLLASCDSEMRVWVWHNGDHAETLDVVRNFQVHPRFHKLYVSAENLKLRAPTNWFWANSDGEYLSKVDDDCLLPDGWAAKLRQAHRDEPKLGVIGCWRFYEEDFMPSLAAKKIRICAGGHQVMVHGFVQGSGHVIKRAVYDQLGPIRTNESFTGYCIRAACLGWINGWYYPFIHEDHMDDARSPNYPIRTEEEFQRNLSLSQINFGVKTLADWQIFGQVLARHLQSEVFDPQNYGGWRFLLRKLHGLITRNQNFLQRNKRLISSLPSIAKSSRTNL
jgi:hypothetical protein